MENPSAYREEYRTRHKRIEIVCVHEEYDVLKVAAIKHGKKLSPFIRECAFAYLKEGFILPDEEAVSALKRELRRWGNNLNQIAYHANKTQSINASQITQAIKLVQALEQKIEHLYRQPKSIRQVIIEEVKREPDLIPRIQYLLNQISQ